MNRLLIPVLALLAAPVIATAQTVTLTEWPVPWQDTRPRDPYVAGDGKVWFVGQAGNYIAWLEPAKSEFKRFAIEDGTYPHNLIVDDDGMVWYAGNRNGRIGRLDPATGAITTYMMPDTLVRDPHTLVFDKAGHIWFTAQGGNHVGRLHKASGKIELVKVATPRARPYGIVIDSRGDAWVNLFGTNKLARVDAKTLKIEEITLPDAEARTRRIGITRDGAVWYVDYMRGYLGRYDATAKTFREWPLPGGQDSRPYAMAIDETDRIWIVETGSQPNVFVGFDPKAEAFLAGEQIESGGGTVRHMVYHQPTRSVWFGTDAGTIGRAVLP